MNARTLAPIPIACLAGAAAGWVLRGASAGAGSAAAERPARFERSAEVERAEAELAPAPAPPASDAGRAAIGPVPLLPPALLAYARDGIRRGWKRERADAPADAVLERGLARFEEEVLALPERIGATLAAEQTALETAAAAGPAFTLLLEIERGGGPALEVASDRARMEALLAREAPESVLGALDHLPGLGAALADGVTLLFPPGVFRIDDRDLVEREPFPRDVTLAGAGRDATLLLVDGVSPRSKLRTLALRDCTILVEDGLFDLRREPAALRLDRVRVVGQDCSHGGCTMLAAPGMVVLATDCEILGGYGRSRGGGRIFEDRARAFVGRFDRCTFAEQRIGIGNLPPNAAVCFTRCRFVGAPDAVEAQAAAHPGVALMACAVTYAEPGAAPPQHDLDELFPDWRSRIE